MTINFRNIFEIYNMVTLVRYFLMRKQILASSIFKEMFVKLGWIVDKSVSEPLSPLQFESESKSVKTLYGKLLNSKIWNALV